MSDYEQVYKRIADRVSQETEMAISAEHVEGVLTRDERTGNEDADLRIKEEAVEYGIRSSVDG